MECARKFGKRLIELNSIKFIVFRHENERLLTRVLLFPGVHGLKYRQNPQKIHAIQTHTIRKAEAKTIIFWYFHHEINFFAKF